MMQHRTKFRCCSNAYNALQMDAVGECNHRAVRCAFSWTGSMVLIAINKNSILRLMAHDGARSVSKESITKNECYPAVAAMHAIFYVKRM
mmetsp:Transcript_83970/g.166723  ORF Transcript_83970/g.166723 Transcript_83970/m.166723 type:complete len:90 (+) Transcript_83970:1741-2010(+)